MFTLKKNNQLVLLSGILVLMATATIATTYNVQTVEAADPKNLGEGFSSLATSGGFNDNNPSNGNGLGGPISGLAGPTWGKSVSEEATSLAHNPP